MSFIKIAPSLKGQVLNFRNMVFKHEFLHVAHINGGFANYRQFSERAASKYSYDYLRAFKMPIPNWINNNLGNYPSEMWWGNFTKSMRLWIK
ncbi:hypothetical protein [Pedobacter alpinus]|uniref:Tox-MPTase4 domain-containing protein n=1 Tax=Pedobacter alpinus TaxID=1590643 RepID=A0ABW5TLT9_9SPHI